MFLAAAAGMRLGWSVISPGNRPRGQVLAEQGRAVVSVAVGLAVVLLVSGLIEAMVTPSPLPTFVRIAIGVLAEARSSATSSTSAGRPSRRVNRAMWPTRPDVDRCANHLPREQTWNRTFVRRKLRFCVCSARTYSLPAAFIAR